MKYLIVKQATPTELGKCVQPTMEEPACWKFHKPNTFVCLYCTKYKEYLDPLEKKDTTCTLPVGEWFAGKEQKQCWGIVNATDEQHWKNVDDSEYRVCPPDRRRLVIVPVEQGKVEPKDGVVFMTIGQLVKQKMEKNMVDSISGVKDDTLIHIINDAIYPNNIPIIIFRNMIRLLGISFPQAAAAMWGTFGKLEESKNNAQQRFDTRSDLWECKDALHKYINRLKELLNDDGPPKVEPQPVEETKDGYNDLVKKLKEIKKAFQWTWDNQGAEHTTDHFNIPANGIELLIEVIEEAKTWAGEMRNLIDTINDQAYRLEAKERAARTMTLKDVNDAERCGDMYLRKGKSNQFPEPKTTYKCEDCGWVGGDFITHRLVDRCPQCRGNNLK